MGRNFKYTICGVSAAMLALTGCNNDTLPGGDALTEIRLRSGLEVMSRAYTPKQESQIASGEKVYIWSDEASNGVSHFNAWELTADGNGGFNALPDVDKRYFPKSGDAINLYAIHGNFGSGVVKNETAFPVQGNPVVHSVETDQTAGGNYEKSDLLYATKHGIEKTKDAITLEFYHMLSKVEIAIRPGDGLTKENLEGATVKIVNTKTQVEFVPAKVGDLSAVNRGEMLSATGTAQDITLPTVSVENGGNEFISADNYGEAIVVPQLLTLGTKFIEVKPEGMAPLYYKLASDFTIESGKKYTFHITVNLTELEVTSSIENWEDGTTEEGGASFPLPPAKVGDYYYSDGTYSSDLNSEKTPIGIVFYVGHHQYDASDYSDTGIGQAKCKGYVVALEDATNSECTWGNSYEAIGNHPVENDGSPFDNYHNPDKDWSGFAYTQAIVSKAGGEEYLDGSNIYPATYYATVSYEGKIAAPAGSSGWFLPSIGQIYEVFLNRGFLFDKGGNNLKDVWYWSSSESGGAPDRYALFLYVNHSSADSYPKGAISGYVRPILAF